MCYTFEIKTLPIEKHFHLRCIKSKQPSNQIDVTQFHASKNIHI